MGHCLKASLLLNSVRRHPDYDEYLKETISKVMSLADKSKNLTERELGHIKAVRCLAQGDAIAATEEWEKILIEYPTDILALRLVNDVYFFLGYQREMRDSVSRVLPFWQSGELPLKEYVKLVSHTAQVFDKLIYLADTSMVCMLLDYVKPIFSTWPNHKLAK